jgi:MYXO-CTERM domain-containing protein
VEAERPAGRFATVLVAVAALIFAAATIYAARAGDAGRTILGGGAAAIEALIAIGGVLLAAVGCALAATRGFALAAVALWGLWLVQRPAARRGPQPLLAAIALGGVAQAFLLAGQIALGAAAYALAAAAVWLAPPPSSVAAAPSRLTLPCLSALLLVFAALCLYRLEVFPNLYVDEMAYLRAARMFAGQIEVGRILGRGPYELYVYDQFAAQTVPIALQAAAVSALPSDVIATRLLSVVAVAGALVLAVLALRRPLGERVGVWMLALGVASPLLVVYSRAGFYISVSVLHSVAAFASLLWLYRRWDPRAAIAVGVLLGASFYQYQLSWFVPVFALVGFAVMPELWRRAGVGRVVAAVVISGGVTVLPAFLWLDTGIDAVNAQTFDRAVWNAPGPGAPASPHETWTGVLAVLPESVDPAEVEAFVAEVAERGLTPTLDDTPQGRRIVWIGGLRPDVEAVVAGVRAERADWLLLDFDWINKDPLDRFQRMLSQLFYQASWESSGRWTAGPLFNPALAPLVVVGLALAWRRRREPALRLLGIWVVGGALLPAVFGGPAPRRTSLMLPFVYAVMALPLVEIGRRLAGRAVPVRAAVAALGVAAAFAAIATGSHLYFRDWEHQAGLPGGGGELLDYVKVLKTRPDDEAVLSPAMYRGLDNYLDAGDASRFWPELETRQFRKRPLLAVRELSCAQPPPFTWIARDVPEHREALAFVGKHFEVESDDQAGLLVRRATAVRGALCAAQPGARRFGKPPRR